MLMLEKVSDFGLRALTNTNIFYYQVQDIVEVKLTFSHVNRISLHYLAPTYLSWQISQSCKHGDRLRCFSVCSGQKGSCR